MMTARRRGVLTVLRFAPCSPRHPPACAHRKMFAILARTQVPARCGCGHSRAAGCGVAWGPGMLAARRCVAASCARACEPGAQML